LRQLPSGRANASGRRRTGVGLAAAFYVVGAAGTQASTLGIGPDSGADSAAALSRSLAPRSPDRWVPEGIAFWDVRHGLAWFTAAFHCPRRGSCAMVGRTDDGGRSWQVVLRPRSVGQIVAAPGSNTAWMVDDQCDYWPKCRPTLFRSDDRGRTWHAIGRALLGLNFPTTQVGFGSLYDSHDHWTLWRSGEVDGCQRALS